MQEKHFPPVTAAQWKAQLEKDLKGKLVEDLTTSLPDGIAIYPFYTQAPTLPHVPKAHEGWETVAAFDAFDASSNARILQSLQQGADSLLLFVTDDSPLDKILHGVELPYIGLHLVTNAQPATLRDALLHVGQPAHGSINFDPLENLARTGNWLTDEPTDKNHWLALQNHNSSLRTACVNANLFAEAGASPALQLGIALSMLATYRQWNAAATDRGAWVNLSVGGDYFTEIAKLRAMRLLWAALQEAEGATAQPLYLYAETALRNKSILDFNNNLIRSSTESMAAAIGGADALYVQPFDLEGADFASRISRYQSLVLQHEAALHHTPDAAAGSYFLDDLTRQLCEKGWEWFGKIDAHGGYLNALASGYIQDTVGAQDRAEREALASGSTKLVGVNRYPHPQESRTEIPVRQKKQGAVCTPLTASRLAQPLEA